MATINAAGSRFRLSPPGIQARKQSSPPSSISFRASYSSEQEQQKINNDGASLKTLGETSGLSAAEAAIAVTISDGRSDTGLKEETLGGSTPTKLWRWRGLYNINYLAALESGGPAVLLVHGFGASIGHFRRNIPVLAKDYSVYAVDLLGLGASEKPPDFVYTIEEWSQLVLDFIRDVMHSSPTVLVGNSIGSLVCLTAAADAPENLIRGVVLLNCAGGMNNKAIVDDWRLRLATPLLWLIDQLLKQPGISTRLFNRVKTKDNLKTVLSSIYCNKEAVDDELIEIIQKPAGDPGALEAFVSIVTGPPGPTPMSLMERINGPLLVLWGDTDSFTPIDGPVGKYFCSLPNTRADVQLEVLENVGHCPHDDRPELVHEKLLPWLTSLGK